MYVQGDILLCFIIILICSLICLCKGSDYWNKIGRYTKYCYSKISTYYTGMNLNYGKWHICHWITLILCIFIQKLGYKNAIAVDVKIQNWTATFDAKHKIRLEGLLREHSKFCSVSVISTTFMKCIL